MIELMVLRQVKVAEKPNEITVTPYLLATESARYLVTIDAMGCRKNIATQNSYERANYLLSMKDTPLTLVDAFEAAFPLARCLDTAYHHNVLRGLGIMPEVGGPSVTHKETGY
ncbi:hypothetical protein [Chromohalobacter sp. 48-RD10]|uniref:hypothetical protein n=1 Tax=Chromohalobacter sp. 48-RD10 TaxID=2994063 RepID=UPI0024699141|nr:hypothetical protein [Chromohalobacter sp. 48-RD10]